ncbi:MAG: DUF6029 family protein [Chitinophagaceae bacterium]
MKKILSILFLFIYVSTHAQLGGNISGDLMMNVNFFQRDTTIKAAGNPLYDNLLSGGEGWLGLRYSTKGFNAAVRFDGFHNSNLLNPTSALTAGGIGMFNLSKEYKNLTISAGHIYDQIGSGILFRAYEDRGLLIDNALFGLHLKYQASDHLTLKGFTGQSKVLFERYKPIIKGANVELDYDLGKKKTAHITPGIGILNRTLDQDNMNIIVSTINAMPIKNRFTPTYNMYGMTIYNTLNVGNFSWYGEAAFKSNEAIADAAGNLQGVNGNTIYTTLGYAFNKVGLNAAFRSTTNFQMRTSPNENLLRGILNWQPIIAQIRPQRLIARYTPPSQNLDEVGGLLNAYITPNDKISITTSYTHINQHNGTPLYREAWAETELRYFKKLYIHLGGQYLYYNQSLYQGKIKSEYPDVIAITPFAEFIYKITEKKSLRSEIQYMSTKQDFGSWAFLLFEYNIAPSWSFAVSDMYNIAPNKHHIQKANHYPNIFLAHTIGPHRFTAQYVKQVEGINCTGGVCRYEPAFSGFKLGIVSSF